MAVIKSKLTPATIFVHKPRFRRMIPAAYGLTHAIGRGRHPPEKELVVVAAGSLVTFGRP